MEKEGVRILTFISIKREILLFASRMVHQQINSTCVVQRGYNMEWLEECYGKYGKKRKICEVIEGGEKV